MMNPGYIAAHRMIVNRQNLQIVANNLAASSVPGYQADISYLREHQTNPGSPDSWSYAVPSNIIRDTRPGQFISTGSNFDIALMTPDVYFSVQKPNGQVLYTRSGQLELNADRQLVQSSNKYLFLDRNGSPIQIPMDQNHIVIAEDGLVTANGNIIAQIGVFKFDNPSSLEKVGSSLLNATGEAQPINNVHIVQQGFESSNVNPVISLAQLIEIQRQDAQDAYVLKTYKEQSGQQIDDLLVPLT